MNVGPCVQKSPFFFLCRIWIYSKVENGLSRPIIIILFYFICFFNQGYGVGLIIKELGPLILDRFDLFVTQITFLTESNQLFSLFNFSSLIFLYLNAFLNKLILKTLHLE